ncbi:MAG: hypothetical protein K2Z80_29685 [Xanthobacteraceae bacterium]|nr:hypothetical protein [Xanthobacteraceae bacterium]
MKALVKPAVILGVAGVLTLGSMTASEARYRGWVAGAAGFAVGAAIGAAAANASYYNAGYYAGGYYGYEPAYAYDSYGYSPTDVAPAVTAAEPAPVYVQQAQYRDPAFAYTGDPAYRRSYRTYGVAPAVTAAEPAPVYAQQAQYRDPAFAYTGDPAYRRSYRTYRVTPAYARQAQYRDPAFAYTGDPAYRRSYQTYGVTPGYDAYAFAPGYRVYRGGYYDSRIWSVPPHYDPGSGYNRNTLAPWQDWKLQGYDY